MSTERIAELKAQIRGCMAQLVTIGFPLKPLDTDQQINTSNAEQTVIGNRIQKLNVEMAAARAELKTLTDDDIPAVPDDVALLHIVMHIGKMSEADKLTQGRTSFKAWRKLCAEAAAGTL